MPKISFFTLLFSGFFALFPSFGIPGSPPWENDEFIVVLDAGHGGHDPGNLGNGYLEKNIALSIVLTAGEWLEKHPDVKVIYTRKDDSFVDLYVRGQIANEADADLFVSVHCDSHSSDANGAGTFVLGLHANEQNFEIAKKENSVIYLEDNYEARYAEYDINSPESIIGLTIMQEEFLDQSIMLAQMMQENFAGRLKRNDRQVKQAGFIVLHQTFMPSVLVETGFLTNRSEGNYLNSRQGQQEMGKAIADAIILYKNNLLGSDVPPVAASEPALNSTSQVSIPLPEEVARVTRNPEETGPEPADEAPEEEPIVRGESEHDADWEEGLQNEQPAVENPGQQVQESEPASAVSQAAREKVQEAGTVATAEKEIPDPDLAMMEPPATDSGPPAPVTAPESPVVTITFKVQLMASSKDLPLNPDDFGGLNRLSKEPYKNLYRYFYGNTASYREARLLKSNADIKGYTTSFIVAYKDGVRIPVAEALKYAPD